MLESQLTLNTAEQVKVREIQKALKMVKRCDCLRAGKRKPLCTSTRVCRINGTIR